MRRDCSWGRMSLYSLFLWKWHICEENTPNGYTSFLPEIPGALLDGGAIKLVVIFPKHLGNRNDAGNMGRTTWIGCYGPMILREKELLQL